MNWSVFASRGIMSVVTRSTETRNVGWGAGATCARAAGDGGGGGAACAYTGTGREDGPVATSSAKAPADKNLAMFRMVVIILRRPAVAVSGGRLPDFDASRLRSVWLYP